MALIDRIEESLKRLLADASPAVREAAEESFDSVRARRALGDFQQQLLSGTVESRIRVTYAAGKMGGAEGVQLLLAALENPEAEVRAVAARELSAHISVPVLKAIADHLPKERGVVLANLIETLGLSRRKEVAPVVDRFLGDPDPEVNANAIVACARVAGAEAIDKVLPFAGVPSDTVRAAVARALGECC